LCGHPERTEDGEKMLQLMTARMENKETWTTGRPRKRWTNEVEEDLKITGIGNGIQWPETGRYLIVPETQVQNGE